MYTVNTKYTVMDRIDVSIPDSAEKSKKRNRFWSKKSESINIDSVKKKSEYVN